MKWENLSLKGALAFFLVCVSALMVFFWMLRPPSGDPNSLALLAGFVMLFIKMAADAVGYQYNSSSGSEKKDETQAKVASALAEKVVTGTGNGVLGGDAMKAAVAAAAMAAPAAAAVAAPAAAAIAAPPAAEVAAPPVVQEEVAEVVPREVAKQVAAAVAASKEVEKQK